MKSNPAITYARFTKSLRAAFERAVCFSSMDTLRGVIIASPFSEDDFSPEALLVSSDFLL